MSMPKGTYLGGVRTLQDLMERCFVDPESGCWNWRGGMSHGFPCLSLSLAGGGKGPSMRGQRAALILSGHDLKSKDIAHPYKCMNHLCVNPAHGGTKTRKRHWEWMESKGLCVNNIKHIAATIRRNKERAIVTPEMVQKIQASDGTCADVARELGISASSVSNYRRGVNGGRRAFSAASVFTWRPAA